VPLHHFAFNLDRACAVRLSRLGPLSRPLIYRRVCD
jgi:hypothetical protein